MSFRNFMDLVLIIFFLSVGFLVFFLGRNDEGLNVHAVEDPEEIVSMVEKWVPVSLPHFSL